MIAQPIQFDRCSDQEDAVWSGLLGSFDRILRNYLLGRGVTQADADDIAQEVYIKLLRCLPSLNLTHGCFGGWLRRVAERTLADRRRAEGRRRRTEAEWFRRRPNEPREDDRLDVLEQTLQRVRARTPALTWHCFEAQLLQRRGAAEIAAACGLTVNAVRVRTSRVLSRLRRLCRAALSRGTTAPFHAPARTVDCNQSLVTPVLLPRMESKGGLS